MCVRVGWPYEYGVLYVNVLVCVYVTVQGTSVTGLGGGNTGGCPRRRVRWFAAFFFVLLRPLAFVLFCTPRRAAGVWFAVRLKICFEIILSVVCRCCCLLFVVVVWLFVVVCCWGIRSPTNQCTNTHTYQVVQTLLPSQ